MTSARALLHSIGKLSYPQRMRLLARHARQLEGTPQLGTLVAEVGRGDSFARDMAVFLAGTARDVEALRPFLADADDAIRARAVKSWLNSGRVDHEEVALLMDDAPYAIRQVVYTHLRRKRSRRRTPGLADVLVDRVASRFGSGEASRLLPACAPQTVARLLPELGMGSAWHATAVAHPEQALAEARRQLARLPESQRTSWWGWVGFGVFGAAREHPLAVLDLLAEYAPATTLPGHSTAHARLARAYPQRFLDLLLDRGRAQCMRRAPLSRALLQALSVLPDDQIIRLAVRLREAGRLPELLTRLAPSRRSEIFDGAYAGVDRDQATVADALLEVLPWQRRVAEARRMLALERVQSTADQVRLTAFLPWEQAQPTLLTATRSPVADERAYAYENIVRCAARSAEPGVVTEAARLLERLRNEQDPVRSRALAALAAVPTRLIEAAAVDTLTTVFADALAARDASGATRSAVARVALGVLATHADDAALSQPALLWLEALFGDDRLPHLGRFELRRGQEQQAFAAVREWIANGVRRNRYALLLRFTAALGRRAYHLPELQELLRVTIRDGRPSSVVRDAVELWLADPAHRDTRVEEVLRGDPSTIALYPVWQIVSARRTDLLDLAFGTRAPAGAFIAKGPRWVPGHAGHVRRWLPHHRARYVELLGKVAADAGASVNARCAAIRSAAVVPDLGWAAVQRWHGSPDVALAEAALGALPWTDRPADALPLLMAHTGDDRARVAVYAMRRAARFVPASRLGEIVAAALAGPLKVTSRKEIARLAADFGVPQASSIVYAEWRRPDAHRDVRAALVGVARQRPDEPDAWRILTGAVESGEYASIVAVGAAQPMLLPDSARTRYASLILAGCRSTDPKAAEHAWACVPMWAPWAADLDSAIMAGLLDLSPTGPARYAIAALVTLLRAGAGYTTLGDALHRLVDLDRADPGDDPERDRIPLRHAQSLLSAVASAVRGDPSGFDLDAAADAARHAADHDPLLVEAVRLLVEVTGEDGIIEACDRLTDRPAAAASVAEDIRAAALRRDWTRERAPRLARRLRDRGDLAGGLAAAALCRLGVSVGFAEPYRGLVRSLRTHPVPDVRDAAHAVRLSDR
ncbi:hypothetical protein Cme02nite_28540 [Catellatospora methionotrophica]|uniref:Uncharacterized protein n=1 Tax=Catellatospora methionotrophica TaxID=121620 RepID=A0A8J3PET8_9ACTN|nr:hypothetical protein [Catellatospora methionotrophica]GIG14522.1 hypothetical protein Cme02nite_28540 [Catellatospora methionotrophica]